MDYQLLSNAEHILHGEGCKLSFGYLPEQEMPSIIPNMVTDRLNRWSVVWILF